MNYVSKIIIIIIIIIIIKDKNEDQRKRERNCRVRERRRERDFYFLFFFLFVSFSDLRKSDNRFSSGLKAKLIHEVRATRGYKILEFRQFP